jgi:hypothetical protein
MSSKSKGKGKGEAKSKQQRSTKLTASKSSKETWSNFIQRLLAACLSYLDAQDGCRSAVVCHGWQLCGPTAEHLWQQLFNREFGPKSYAARLLAPAHSKAWPWKNCFRKQLLLQREGNTVLKEAHDISVGGPSMLWGPKLQLTLRDCKEPLLDQSILKPDYIGIVKVSFQYQTYELRWSFPEVGRATLNIAKTSQEAGKPPTELVYVDPLAVKDWRDIYHFYFRQGAGSACHLRLIREPESDQNGVIEKLQLQSQSTIFTEQTAEWTRRNCLGPDEEWSVLASHLCDYGTYIEMSSVSCPGLDVSKTVFECDPEAAAILQLAMFLPLRK